MEVWTPIKSDSGSEKRAVNLSMTLTGTLAEVPGGIRAFPENEGGLQQNYLSSQKLV
jgi:hypothetical protein